MKYVLRYIHAMSIGPEYYVDKSETKEEFDTLDEAMERWYWLWEHTDASIYDITHGDKVYTFDDFDAWCEEKGKE